MGVPHLFKTIISKYPDCHFWDDNHNTDHLYFDYNCLIHFCKAELKINDDMCSRDIEEELITLIISYTTNIITKIIKPKKLVYIAIDGPVPMGKIVQQRKRRYKKVQDDSFIKKLNEKYEKKQLSTFNSNKITPGTVFMAKLCGRLKNLISLNAFSLHIPENEHKKFSVFLSDSNVPGEGEHKIMNFIANNENNPNITIYGLDADLIVLSMASNKGNIKLLREPQNTTTEMGQYHMSKFLYLDIDKYSTAFFKEYDLNSYDKSKIINDYVFCSFFGGNDFVEPLINSKIKDKNLNTIFNVYTQILFKTQSYFINDDGFINIEFLTEYLTYFSDNEDMFVKKKQFQKNFNHNKIDDKYENELQLYYHSSYQSKLNPFYEYYKNHFNAINYNLPHDTWKEQYYNYFTKSTNLDEMCYDYLFSLMWTFKYYTQTGVPSWYFYYKHRVAPCPSDLLEYVKTHNIKDTDFIFETGNIISPIEQLLYVTPIQHYKLLPMSYQLFLKGHTDDEANINLSEIFPCKFQLDVLKGGKNIYSDPIIPDIDINTILTILKMIPVNQIEYCRNKIKDKTYCVKF